MFKLRILVVDDSVTIRELIKDAFSKRGFFVMTAEDGQGALEITLKEHPDIIISDISMPGMDGWDFCNQVRKNPYTSFIPFVFLSKKSEAPDRIRGLQMGADDYLTKPFEMDELVARVELIINRIVKAQEAALSRGRDKGLSGSTKEMSLPDLLQLFHTNRKTGILKIRRSASMEGYIAFRDGDIVGAGLGGFRPLKAVHRMLGWDEAKFELEPLITQTEEAPMGGVESLLLDGFRQQDELERLKKEKPIGKIKLVPDALRNLSALSDTQKKLLVRARKFNDIEGLLNIEDISDLDAYEATLSLMEMGYIVEAN